MTKCTATVWPLALSARKWSPIRRKISSRTWPRISLAMTSLSSASESWPTMPASSFGSAPASSAGISLIRVAPSGSLHHSTVRSFASQCRPTRPPVQGGGPLISARGQKDERRKMSTFDLGALGMWTEPKRFTVERERVAAYAAATNDPIAEHRAGTLAPPVFAMVPAFEATAEAVLAVAPAELLITLVHGEQDFAYHRPIEAGMDLVTPADGCRTPSGADRVTRRSEEHT